MEALKKLSRHLARRPIELRKLRDEGVKIIGYIPNGFLPGELIWACGAVPVGLIRGGEPEPVAVSGAYIPRFVDTFCRSQIGYRELGEELYQMIDLLAVAVTDNNMRGLADTWDFYTPVEVYRVGIPHEKSELAMKYYLEELNLFKEKLEKFTKQEIKDQRLKEEIGILNRIRGYLRDISLMRKSNRPPISGKDFCRLNHASYIADKFAFVEVLEALRGELKAKEAEVKAPRILLTGSTLAMGDYKVLDLVEDAGAEVVIEEFCTGIRPYWEDVAPDGDLTEALADKYLKRRVPSAFQVPSEERVDFLLRLARDFRANGIIWYQQMYNDAYHVQSYYFEKILRKELNIPMLKLESDYDRMEVEPMRTRVETFIETLKRG